MTDKVRQFFCLTSCTLTFPCPAFNSAMSNRLHIDDDWIDNIELHSSSIKDTINAALIADEDKATTDINYIKNLIDRLIPQNVNPEEKAILLLFVLQGYSEQNDTQLVAAEIRGFFTTLCLTLLHDLNFTKIYRNKILQALFNEMLLSYLRVCNELKTARLFEAFLKFKQQFLDNNLQFFQVHVVKQLFYHGSYDKINYILAKYNIDDFDGMLDRELIENGLFSYYHQLSHSATVSKSYERAYQIIHVTMDLYLFVNIPEFQLVLSEYIFLSLMLNKGAKTTDVTIYKYKTKLFPRLLKVYQSYQAYDLESFVFNYLLYIHHLHHNEQKLLSQLFNFASLDKLSHQLIDNKLGQIAGKFNEEFIFEQQTMINTLISEINKGLLVHNFQLSEYRYKTRSTAQNADHKLLLQDCKILASFTEGLQHAQSLNE